MEEGESDPSLRTRTFDVTLQGGAPWGFSVKGGSEHRCPLTIARIEAGGKASQSGDLQVDDIILSINNVECESHSEAIQLVKGSPSILKLIIQRSGSDLHLRQAMKQTDYYKPSSQDLSPRDIKSPRIYDVQPPASPQTYKKSEQAYDIKKSSDYDVPPSSVAGGGGVSRRLKKGETAGQPRPKSWHFVEGNQTWEDPTLKKPSKSVAQPVPKPAPQNPSPHAPRLDPSSSMDNLTVLQTFHKRTMPRSNAKSMSNLQGFKDETELDPGFVKRRVSDYISSSNRELSTSGKDKDFYFVPSEKRGPIIPYNPKFQKDVNLQPAETYPKVAMATQLQCAQQRAYIGRVPDAQTSPEPPQTFSTSQVVSYSTVQMPQRHYASTIELGGKWDESSSARQQSQGQVVSPPSGHPVYRATPRMSPSPTPSDKREPPTPPQRGDSRNKAHRFSSWPVPNTNVQDSKRNDNNCTPSSVISPSDLPPVKLSSEQELSRPNQSKGFSTTGDQEFSYSYANEPFHSATTSVPVYSSSSSKPLQGSRESTGSETFPGRNYKSSQKQESLYTAKPCYVDPESDFPETDTNSWFPSSSPQNVEKQHSSYGYQPQGSPPTRDNVDSITEDKDPLIMSFQSYMQTVLDQEERLQDVNPDGSSTGSESPKHQPHIMLYPTPSSEYNQQHSQTLPAYVARNDSEKRLSRTSVSSLDSHSSSNHRVKSPITRLSSDEEEQNRINSQLGNTNQRTWKNPNDFSSKKAVIDSEEQWQKMVIIADPKWGERYSQADISSAPKSEGHVRVSSQIDENLICGNAPGMRSPISQLMMEAVTTDPPKSETITEAQPKDIKLLKTEGRDSGYEVDSDNPFRAQEEASDHVHGVADTFSSDDWMKLDNMESSGGTSILSQLQKETPFSQRYINGEPIVKSTVDHETKVEIKIDSHGSPTSESSRQQFTRPETSSTQSSSSRPQPLYQPKNREDFLKEMKNPSQISKDARNTFFGSQPQLSKQTGSDKSSHHYHSSSLDLDTRVTGPQLMAQSSFPPWKPETGEEPNSNVSHSRSYSYSGGFYPGYSGPSEPRFTRIDEEQGPESSESGPSSRFGTKSDPRSASLGSVARSRESYDGDMRDHRQGTSDSKSMDSPTRKTSFESSGRHPKEGYDYTSQHQYSKSDSEQHRKIPAVDQRHKNSDPSGAIRKSHRVSDPEDRRHIRDVLFNFVQSKKGPLRSDGSVFGSQQGSLSDYASMQSLDQYSSTSSLHRRHVGGMDSVGHSQQSSYSSVTSHAHRDSGIVSPVESSWGPPSPNISPPGVMDHRQRSQQRPSGSDNNHQRAASDSTSPVDRVRDSNLSRNSFPMLDDYRPVKKIAQVNRSQSMSQAPRRRPQSYHDPRTKRDDLAKGLTRTETFSTGQRRSGSHGRPLSNLSATLPALGYRDSSAKSHWASGDSGQQYPSRGGERSQSMSLPEDDDDVPPALPPKQIKEAQVKTIAKVEPRRSEDDGSYRSLERERERKISAPAKSVFNYQSPPRQEQQRFPSPKTSPTFPVSKEASPTHPVTTETRKRTSPTLPGRKDPSPTHPVTTETRTRTSPTLPGRKERSPTHQFTTEPRTKTSTLPSRKEPSLTHQFTTEPRTKTSTLPSRKEPSPTHQFTTEPRTRTSPTLSSGKASPSSIQITSGSRSRTSSSPPASKEASPTAPRPRTDSLDLPPPPTPPAVPSAEDIDLSGDLPPPPPEVLNNRFNFQEEKTVQEEPITPRSVASTQAAVSFPQAKPDRQVDHISPFSSPPTSSPYSLLPAEERPSVSADPGIDPQVGARSETAEHQVSVSLLPGSQPEEVVVDPSCDKSVDVIDGGDISEVSSVQSRISSSPVNRRTVLDLDLDDEAGPIEVVEIVHTPTLSPKRGDRSLSGNEEEHSQDSIVDSVLQSLDPQDFALRELFQFPEEPLKVGSRTSKKMPHEKKEEARTPKRSECDVKSLTGALSSSMYLQISPAKALLLTRAKDMMGSDMVQGDDKELRKTKEELIGRLARKVSELKKESHQLQEEMRSIEDLGRQVTENVRKSCKPSSVDKYLMYVGDADSVTKLLLTLSRRLTKVNSLLNSLEDNDEEEAKADLQKMHKDLTSKYEDAKGLKVSIDARHVQISSMLQDHLSAEEYEDFCHFVPMRSRLRIMSQELEDRIKLGEEQLEALRASLKGERSQGEGSQCSLDSS